MGRHAGRAEGRRVGHRARRGTGRGGGREVVRRSGRGLAAIGPAAREVVGWGVFTVVLVVVALAWSGVPWLVVAGVGATVLAGVGGVVAAMVLAPPSAPSDTGPPGHDGPPARAPGDGDDPRVP